MSSFKQLTELVSESTITIHRVSSDDYGKYECKARNKVGSVTDDVFLNVTSSPDKPSELRAFNVTHDTVFLDWKKGFDGGLPTSYQIRWRQALDYEDRYYYLDVSVGQNTAMVPGLNLGTFYVFSIRAINAKGKTPWLPDLVKVQTSSEYLLIIFYYSIFLNFSSRGINYRINICFNVIFRITRLCS